MGPYCKFCDSRCFIPADLDDREVPKEFQTKFVERGCPILATCAAGKVLDKSVLGFSADDLIWKTEAKR
jgi:hypothetical protein